VPFFREVLELPEVSLDDADGARIVGFAAGEPIVELLEAEDENSPIGRFIDRRGPGIHHICFAVDDLDANPRIGAEGKRIAFLHPRSTGGVLIELSDH
jgi:methylmalonyl-CoA/ethylmalonyl-CoA epimerase